MKHDNEEEHDHPELSDLISKVNDHVDTRMQYLRLIVSEKIAIAASRLYSSTILLVAVIFFFLFISITAALCIGKHYGDNVVGFGAVSGFYFICLIIYMLLRKPVFEKKMQDNIVRSMFEERKEEEDED
ncbi:MAG TPA: hypothetical protein VL651_03755 [Bacteroidia bacterium]|jgi:hypothetical protein|nr:hypothetical protein [Bacteroidia bacterium]